LKKDIEGEPGGMAAQKRGEEGRGRGGVKRGGKLPREIRTGNYIMGGGLHGGSGKTFYCSAGGGRVIRRREVIVLRDRWHGLTPKGGREALACGKLQSRLGKGETNINTEVTRTLFWQLHHGGVASVSREQGT